MTAEPQHESSLIRTSAALWSTGGVTWLVAGLVEHATLEALWLLADLLLLAAMGLLFQEGRRDGTWLPTRTATAGLAIAIAARVAFIIGEVIAAVTSADENALLPVGAMGTALGLTMLGFALARAHRLDGPVRFGPLAAGLYPFVAMFPILAITGEPPKIGIALWGIPLALIGASLVVTRREAPLGATGAAG